MIQSTGWCHVWHYLHNLHCPGLIRFETTRKSSQWRRSTARVTWPGRLVEDVVHRSIFGASWTRCRLPTVNLISKLWCFVGPFVALRRILFIYLFFVSFTRRSSNRRRVAYQSIRFHVSADLIGVQSASFSSIRSIHFAYRYSSFDYRSLNTRNLLADLIS